MRHSPIAAAWPASAFFCALALALVPPTAASARAAESPGFIASAIDDANRPEADTQRDVNRKPAESLMFAELRPGQQVAELLPGGGYFTRLLSKAVGPTGQVYALVPAPSPDAPADAPDFASRVKGIAADPHYSNLSVVSEPFSQLKAPVPVDLFWTSQNYHDLHNFPGMDVTVFNQLVFDALKPGGLYVILDHRAEAGSGTRDTATLHRIDPALVKKEVLAAGFEFVASSDLLSDPADRHTLKVFDPAVRGKTDQFFLKFRKPKRR